MDGPSHNFSFLRFFFLVVVVLNWIVGMEKAMTWAKLLLPMEKQCAQMFTLKIALQPLQIQHLYRLSILLFCHLKTTVIEVTKRKWLNIATNTLEIC